MAEETTLHPILTFRLAQQQYGLQIEHVLEVAAMVALDTVPDAPPEMLGLANRHGEVLPVIDLRRLFNVPVEPITVTTLFIVANVKNSRIGLVVDEIFQVKYVEDVALKPAHGTGQYVTHIVGDGETLFQLLDISPLLANYLPTE